MEGNFGPFFLQTGKIEYEVCGGKEIVKGGGKVHGISVIETFLPSANILYKKHTARHTN